MNTYRLIGGIIAACLLSGCGGSSNSLPGDTPVSSTQTLPNGLTLEMTADHSNVHIGTTVTYVETYRNKTSVPIHMTFIGVNPGQPVTLFMYYFLRVTGTSVGSIDNAGHMFSPLPLPPPHFAEVTLMPGQVISGTDTYRLTRPDTYTAYATLETDSPQGSTVANYDPIVVRAH